MKFIVYGMNHKTAPIGVREKYALPSEKVREFIAGLKPYASEAVFLSTCNRIEFYLATDRAEESLAEIRRSLGLLHRLKSGESRKYFYLHEGLDAYRHLFRVAGSLDSMVLGEAQILGQVKASYLDAQEAGMTGAFLNGVFHRALRAAKRVRSQTDIARMPVNLSSVAVELTRKIFQPLSGHPVLLLGAGEMIELTAKYLSDSGVRDLTIANRTMEKARGLAARLGGTALTLAEGLKQVGKADILLTSVGESPSLLSRSDLEKAMRRRGGKALFIIDMGVPRNIDPEAGKIDSVYLYNVDDLSSIADSNRAERQKAAEAAESILQEEIDRLCSWLGSLELVPTVVRLRDRFEAVRRSEWEKFIRRNPGMSEQDLIAAERLTKDIVVKLLHQPTVNLKGASGDAGRFEYARMLNELFSLMDQPPDEERGRPS